MMALQQDCSLLPLQTWCIGQNMGLYLKMQKVENILIIGPNQVQLFQEKLEKGSLLQKLMENTGCIGANRIYIWQLLKTLLTGNRYQKPILLKNNMIRYVIMKHLGSCFLHVKENLTASWLNPVLLH